MFGSSNPVVTLNIESDSARLLMVRGRKIEAHKSVPLTADSVKDTAIGSTDAVAAALNDLFKTAKAPRTDVILAITGLRSVYRMVTIPRIKPSKLAEAVRWVAVREIPFGLNEANLVWQELDSSDNQMRVFLLATPARMLQMVKKTLTKARIRTKAYDLKPLALARFVNRPDAIILDVEKGSSTIVVMRDGVPRVMHTIVAQKKDQSAGDRVQRLTNDLNRTVMFYNNAHEDDPITSSVPACVTGKLADDTEMIGLIQDSISYPLAIPERCLDYAQDFPIYEYAVNAGLALREGSVCKKTTAFRNRRCPLNVNIMPDED